MCLYVHGFKFSLESNCTFKYNCLLLCLNNIAQNYIILLIILASTSRIYNDIFGSINGDSAFIVVKNTQDFRDILIVNITQN